MTGPGDPGPAAQGPVTRRVARFTRARPDCVGLVSHLGRSGARLIVLAPDGEFLDQVLPSVPAAEQACRTAGIATTEWTRELSARLLLTPAHRRRMAGSGR